MNAVKYVIADRVLFGRASWWQKFVAMLAGILVTYGAVMIFGVMILVNPRAFLLVVGIPSIIAFKFEVEAWYLAGLCLGAVFLVAHILLAFYNFLMMPIPIFK